MSNAVVGQKVKYWPDKCHALDKDALGDYTWDFLNTQGDTLLPSVWIDRLRERAAANPSDPSIKSLLNPVRPAKEWDAVITAVNADGTVNLDIKHGTLSGITLGYPNIPYADKDARKPHTWHEIEGGN